jgi:hypothetical protein
LTKKQGMAKKVAGGVAGAALGAAAGVALADEDMREKIGDLVDDTRGKGEATLHQIRKAAKKTNGKKH